jgi:hypothetical protein
MGKKNQYQYVPNVFILFLLMGKRLLSTNAIPAELMRGYDFLHPH